LYRFPKIFLPSIPIHSWMEPNGQIQPQKPRLAIRVSSTTANSSDPTSGS